MRTVIIVCLPLALAACGGNSLSNLGPPTGPAAYLDILDEGERLADRVDTFGPTDPLPTSGTATYTGVAAIVEDLDATVAIYGAFDADVNFLSGTLDGSASGFYSGRTTVDGDPIGNGTPIAGNLTYEALALSAAGFDTDVFGSVEIDGTIRAVDGTLFTSFAGPGAEMVFGAGEVAVSGRGLYLNVFLAD